MLFSLIEEYDLLILIDVDCIAVEGFLKLEKQMASKDIGIVRTREKEIDYAKYSAACITFNTKNKININNWMFEWKKAVRKMKRYFFNDQHAMFKAMENCEAEYLELPMEEYCSFIKHPETVLVMTAGKIKETRSSDYNKEFENATNQINKIRGKR